LTAKNYGKNSKSILNVRVRVFPSFSHSRSAFSFSQANIGTKFEYIEPKGRIEKEGVNLPGNVDTQININMETGTVGKMGIT